MNAGTSKMFCQQRKQPNGYKSTFIYSNN